MFAYRVSEECLQFLGAGRGCHVLHGSGRLASTMAKYLAPVSFGRVLQVWGLHNVLYKWLYWINEKNFFTSVMW